MPTNKNFFKRGGLNSGRGGRGFKSRCSDQKRPVHFVYWSFFVFTAGFAAEATAACGGNREPRLGQRSARRECRSRHEADAGQPQPGTGRPCHRRGNQKPSGLCLACGSQPVGKSTQGEVVTHSCTGLFSSSQRDMTETAQSPPRNAPPRAEWLNKMQIRASDQNQVQSDTSRCRDPVWYRTPCRRRL